MIILFCPVSLFLPIIPLAEFFPLKILPPSHPYHPQFPTSLLLLTVLTTLLTSGWEFFDRVSQNSSQNSNSLSFLERESPSTCRSTDPDAKNDMAEDHRYQASEGHRLCANNCGFFGSAATMNLCSKCYRDFRLKEQQGASTKSTIEAALSASASPSLSTSSPLPAVASLPRPPALRLSEVAVDASLSLASVEAGPDAAAAQLNRCATCRKRVGWTGFKCRCGVTFCGAHRYPEKHGCSFDFKKAGQVEIARANPVIIAEKLRKI